MKILKPSLLILLYFIFYSAQAQLLWKVEGNGLKQPSYIIGTYHLAQTSFIDSIAGLKNALEDCEQVYGELNMTQLETDAEATQKMQATMQLETGETLDKLLTAEQITRLNKYLSETLGADLSHPAMASLKHLKPAAITTQLVLLMGMELEDGFNPQDQFDTYFQIYARDKNKTVGGLETLEYQTQLLYTNTPIERQIELLMCFIDNADFQRETAKLLRNGFYTQNLTQIQQATEEKLHNACDATSDEEAALIYNRNTNWANLLPTLFKTKSTLVAVGAAHLPGKKGLLQLLRNQGFKVTPAN